MKNRYEEFKALFMTKIGNQLKDWRIDFKDAQGVLKHIEYMLAIPVTIKK